MVSLEYTFLFDSEETFAHLNIFEKALAKFFDENGLEGEFVTGVEGQPGRRIILIKRKPKGVEPLTAKDIPGRKGK
jgi:hypothetical protein